jgi:hypothetical protein
MGKISASCTSDKGLVSTIYKGFQLKNKRQPNF